MRERAVLAMVIFVVMFLLIQSYMGDMNLVGVSEDMEGVLSLREMEDGEGNWVDNSVLPQDIEVGGEQEGGEGQAEAEGADFLTANEIAPPGNLDNMVEDGTIDMEKYIKDTEDRLSSSKSVEAKEELAMDKPVKTELVARPPLHGGHPGWTYSVGNFANYTAAQQVLRRPAFTSPDMVINHSEECICLGLIVINLKKSENLESKFAWKLQRTLRSLMVHSSATPLHFVIVTDQKSITAVGLFFSDFLSKQLSERAILSPSWRWLRSKAPPTIKFSFVDIDTIRNIDLPFIEAMKNSSQKKEEEDKDKYASDLFYISPLYHRSLSSTQPPPAPFAHFSPQGLHQPGQDHLHGLHRP